MESELLRKKHLARFNAEEVCLLLEEMGFDSIDLRGFKLARVSGESQEHRWEAVVQGEGWWPLIDTY